MTTGTGIAYMAAAIATVGTAAFAPPLVLIVGPACFFFVMMAH